MKTTPPVPPGLEQLARDAGLLPHWTDARGRHQQVSPDTLRSLLETIGFAANGDAQIKESRQRLQESTSVHSHGLHVCTVGEALCIPLKVVEADKPYIAYELKLESGEVMTGHAHKDSNGALAIPAINEPGYHALYIGDTPITLAAAPRRCSALVDLAGAKRMWGAVAQVYSLRGGESTVAEATGAGDFGALKEMAMEAAAQHADALAISPVHAMFSADPLHYSPYSPSTRLFLNVLYADPTACLGDAAVRDALRALNEPGAQAQLKAATYIDWASSASLRLRLFQHLFELFCRSGTPQQRNAFIAFKKAGGLALEHHACFEALHGHHAPLLGPSHGWRDWPAVFQKPDNGAVKEFARAHANEVDFHCFLQWLAATSLQLAHQSALEAGMKLGLIADLAIGSDPRGSHTWTRQQEMLVGATVGAPPDIRNPLGQNWGLTTFSACTMRQRGYAAFIEILRASLAHAGGIRIDHVLGLRRLWLVPEGAGATEGAYLRYPFHDLIDLIKLEAHRHRAIVIGENLGTVPDGFNDTLAAAGIMGMAVLPFQQTSMASHHRHSHDKNGAIHDQAASPPEFLTPAKWSKHEVAMSTTHDLATIWGWWDSVDIDWRARLEQLGPEEDEHELRRERDLEKRALWHAMQIAGCVGDDTPLPEDPPLFAIMEFVSSSPAPLALFPLEDILGIAAQPNLPGTIDQHPNWIQRLPYPVDQTFHTARAQEAIRAIRRGRGTRS